MTIAHEPFLNISSAATWTHGGGDPSSPNASPKPTSARADLFFGAMREVGKLKLEHLLRASYEEDPLDTLKIVAHIRDCRGGKGERQLGRWALEWLAVHHHRVLAHNLKHLIARYGRFDDSMALMGTPAEKDALELLRVQLVEDLEILNSEAGNEAESTKRRISLCAKWIPSQSRNLDAKLSLHKKLCKHMKLNSAKLRKFYLTPLRAKLGILEKLMCADDWEAIDFGKVPSVAMQIHGRPQHAFESHVPEQFAAWKKKLATGEAKVNAKSAAVLPHQIVAQYLKQSGVDGLLEAQWKEVVAVDNDASLAVDRMKNTLVMLPDVSQESMKGRPMEVAITLGLLASSLSTLDAFKDFVLTFEPTPDFHRVVGPNLFERIRWLKNATYGGPSTDFTSAFRVILERAKQQNLSADEIPKRLAAVSGVSFDQANSGSFESEYQLLRQEFAEANLEIPHLVFWNVSGDGGASSYTPVFSDDARVTFVSGFSTTTFWSVLCGSAPTPLDEVLEEIQRPRYDAITLPS